MALEHDQPNLEYSPEQHDAEAIEAGSTAADCAAVVAALAEFGAPAGPLLDIGCGTGRHLRLLADQGHEVLGVDLDQRMIDAAEATGVPAGCTYQACDITTATFNHQFAAAFLLNRSLVCFHSHAQAVGLFRTVATHLLPGGLFLIDPPCAYLWEQIRAGMLCDGIDGEGQEQLFFLPGENRFIWRRGEAVDLDDWAVKPSDRIYRAWSLGEIALAAEVAGLALIRLDPDSALIVLARPEA